MDMKKILIGLLILSIFMCGIILIVNSTQEYSCVIETIKPQIICYGDIC